MPAPEADLAALLRTLQPHRRPDAIVFCSLPHHQAIDASACIGLFREVEGSP